MERHEYNCFLGQLAIERDALTPHSLLDGPPPKALIARHDAVLVGGSGDYYVSKGDLPHFESWLDFLRDTVDRGHPTFASCFGYQSLVWALGGDVIHDPANTEVGTFVLELTDDGTADPLIGSLPRVFTAQMGHKDRATRHPSHLANLANSELSPFQALRIPNQPIWATQFHPELDRRTNSERFNHYADMYAQTMSDAERQAAQEGFGESVEASSLLRRFVDLVFG